MSPLTSISALPTSQLSSLASADDKLSSEQMESVGKQFEGVFLSMMLKEMRSTLSEGFFGKESSDTYGGIFDLFIGNQMAESKPLGIANLLLQQYEKNASTPTESAEVNADVN